MNRLSRTEAIREPSTRFGASRTSDITKPPEILEKYSIMAKAKSPIKSKAPATNLNITGSNGAKNGNTTSASSLQASSANVSSIRNAETPRPSPATATEMNPSVSEEQVRRRAYELYVQRGGGDGGHDADWFRAEAELRGRSKAS
jgi:hypothetical protein